MNKIRHILASVTAVLALALMTGCKNNEDRAMEFAHNLGKWTSTNQTAVVKAYYPDAENIPGLNKFVFDKEWDIKLDKDNDSIFDLIGKPWDPDTTTCPRVRIHVARNGDVRITESYNLFAYPELTPEDIEYAKNNGLIHDEGWREGKHQTDIKDAARVKVIKDIRKKNYEDYSPFTIETFMHDTYSYPYWYYADIIVKSNSAQPIEGKDYTLESHSCGDTDKQKGIDIPPLGFLQTKSYMRNKQLVVKVRWKIDAVTRLKKYPPEVSDAEYEKYIKPILGK